MGGCWYKLSRWLLVVLWLAAPGALAQQGAQAQPIEWATLDAEGRVTLHLYFFWTRHCPHCRAARPFVADLDERYDWLQVHALELTGNRDNAALYMVMAESLGQDASSVPAFLYCATMFTGFGSAQTTGVSLDDHLSHCYQEVQRQVDEQMAGLEAGRAATALSEPTGAVQASPVHLPQVSGLNLEALSLPVLTLALAGMDSFNPCAFFVLLFLLSLLVHARSRARMMLVGGVFVLFSGVVYFLFMAAWLNVFQLVGHQQWVTLGAGAVAVAIAVINVKDFFWLKRGVSLSIPEAAKPSLFARMRGLLDAENLATLLVGTVALALAANTYELLCTAGFPMVFTRILTLQELPSAAYYAYLALYNVVYILPLLVIVGLFVATLGGRKLQEREGRLLKLLSGLMMLGLGLVLLVAPERLSQLRTALLLFAVAFALTYLAHRLTRPQRAG